jgi:hypothetical protein
VVISKKDSHLGNGHHHQRAVPHKTRRERDTMNHRTLPRRTFLKHTLLYGAGATVALPVLDSLLPSVARAAGETAASPPTRMAFMSFPNGAIMDSWRPKGIGKDFQLPPTLEPLAALKSELNIISGLAQDNGRAKGDGPGDHARSAASLLTGAHPVKTAGADIKVGQSVDQVAAEQIGHLTRLPSLEIGIERGRVAGSCDSGYSCAYSSCISWKSATTPNAKEIDPRLVFERLFGEDKSAKAGARRDLLRKSVLDLVADDAQRLKERLGSTDRRKVDEYFTSVRELEVRIGRAEQAAKAERPDFEVPERIPRDLQEHIRLMYDLLVLAFQTDTTRIATFMLANEGSNRAYSMVGVTDGHHELSHHRNEEEKVAKLRKIDRFLVGEFAYFLEKLRSVKEGEGTLLDHSMIFYGSGLSDGNRHRHDDLPVILAGRGGGTIATGRHIAIPSETPLNNLFLSMLDRAGAYVESFGDSTGRFKEIEG